MMPLIVPTLGLDTTLLDRLAASIDYPIKHKVVILNGPGDGLNEWKKNHVDWDVIVQTYNLGVAGSWNLAPKLFPDEKSWLICNDDIAFNPNDLQCIFAAATLYDSEEPIILLNDTNPFYCFVWTAKGVNEFGTFDENFWPAYYEDCDMRARHRIAGVQYRYALQRRPPLIHGKPKVGGINYNATIQGCGLFNRRYWQNKWGSNPAMNGFEENTYVHPFKQGIDLSWWKLDVYGRINRQHVWDSFMEQPSLYD